MRSAKIISDVLDDLKSYINDSRVLFEQYGQLISEIELRKDIIYARVALYEIEEMVTQSVDADRANLSVTQYGIDISVVRAYSKDNHTRGESILLDLKDKIIEWSKIVDVATITQSHIMTFGYKNSSTIIRNDRFVTRTLRFHSIRDLHKPQLN